MATDRAGGDLRARAVGRPGRRLRRGDDGRQRGPLRPVGVDLHPRRQRGLPGDARLRDRHRLRQRRHDRAPRRTSRSAAGRRPATATARPATWRSTRSPSGRRCTSTTAGASSAPRSTTSDALEDPAGLAPRPDDRHRRRRRRRRVGGRAAQDVRRAGARGRRPRGDQEPGPARDAPGPGGRRDQLRDRGAARSSASSGPTAPARPPRSRCCRACCTRRRARRGCSATRRRSASATSCAGSRW